MKVYIPFNMIIDTDFGVIRLIEIVQNISKYPTNKLKSFLLKRTNENPIPEYKKLRNLDISEYSYDIILDKYYEDILPLSEVTDMMSFIINTNKLGFSNEICIVVGCDMESEISYLHSILNMKYSIETCLNTDIRLNDFDYIFTKYLNYQYVNYLLNVEKISAKRIYVADYSFNTLYDNKTNKNIIDPDIHMELESQGNILCLISLYNKKK